MSSNGVGSSTSTPGRRRVPISRWLVRLLIAFIIGVVIVLFFFTSSAISR